MLSAQGRTIEIERIDEDQLLIPVQSGKLESRLFRVGSRAAEATAAPPTPLAKNTRSRPEKADPEVDRNVPLDAYVSLNLADRSVGALLVMAFRDPPAGDEVRWAALSGNAGSTSDVFARKELMAKELPAIDARLATARSQRYVRVEAGESVFLQRLPVRAQLFAGWNPLSSSLGHYDIARKGFPMACIEDGSVSAADMVIAFHPEPGVPTRQCLLSVGDEVTAKALETEVSRIGILPMSATFYIVLDGTVPLLGERALAARLAHLQLRVFPADLRPGREQPVATLDLDMPQTLYP